MIYERESLNATASNCTVHFPPSMSITQSPKTLFMRKVMIDNDAKQSPKNPRQLSELTPVLEKKTKKCGRLRNLVEMCTIMSHNKSYGMKITRAFFFSKGGGNYTCWWFFSGKALVAPSTRCHWQTNIWRVERKGGKPVRVMAEEEKHKFSLKQIHTHTHTRS